MNDHDSRASGAKLPLSTSLPDRRKVLAGIVALLAAGCRLGSGRQRPDRQAQL